MSFLGKEFNFVKQDNFDGFLKFVGVPEDKIEALSSFTPATKITKDGDSYTYHTQTPTGPKATTFQSGVEFDDTIGPEKAPIKTTFVVAGDTVTQTIKSDKGSSTFKREFSGDDLVLTITVDGWDGEAKRYYKA